MATVKAINLAMRCSGSMQDVLKDNIDQVVREDQTGVKLSALEGTLAAKQHELAALAKQKKDYTKVAEEVEALRAQQKELEVDKAEVEGYKQRIQEMGSFLDREANELTEYDESMVRNYIKGIKIYDDHFTVSFKAGIDLDIQR